MFIFDQTKSTNICHVIDLALFPINNITIFCVKASPWPISKVKCGILGLLGHNVFFINGEIYLALISLIIYKMICQESHLNNITQS